MLLGSFQPWFDVGLISVSGFDVATAFGQPEVVPEVVRNGMHTMLTGAVPLVVAVAVIALAGVAFLFPARLAAFARWVWWSLALSSAFVALVAGLPAHTQKLKSSLSFGNWIVILAALSLLLDALLGAALHDPANSAEDHSKMIFPAVFLALLVAALIVNYSFVNYTLVPKATEIIQHLTP